MSFIVQPAGRVAEVGSSGFSCLPLSGLGPLGVALGLLTTGEALLSIVGEVPAGEAEAAGEAAVMDGELPTAEGEPLPAHIEPDKSMLLDAHPARATTATTATAQAATKVLDVDKRIPPILGRRTASGTHGDSRTCGGHPATRRTRPVRQPVAHRASGRPQPLAPPADGCLELLLQRGRPEG
ncbi:hypothetical protein AB0F92_42320, partial [Kitasatospora aureofaciens]|uniref:hypothetical protein n=1 Tax=Kitasatospora aureofaciens TaxID=1894 RepID=UPI003402B6D7